MALDGRILFRARQRLDERRRDAEAELETRRERAYASNPQLKSIEAEIKSTMLKVLKAAMSGRSIEDIRRRNISLQNALRDELLYSGFPADYLDPHYSCEKCGDTGYVSGSMCSCLDALYREEQAKELSNLLKLSENTFDSFELDYYDDTPDPETGVSPRMNMEFVRDTCWTYSHRFGNTSKNFYLTGSTGLGKTFLSTCIAKVVSENGYSVVYDTAVSLFNKFEEDKFSKDEDLSEVRGDINRYLSCDLLILDDLGTEMTTSFVVSALYSLVNTRLTSGKKTIISSNLPPEALAGRYSPQIASRILGEYQILKFTGSDIRIIKKNRL